jgi:hypothetical protein
MTQTAEEARLVEEKLIRARRALAGITPEEAIAPTAALALSGGGIRSATFCLGVLRALAKQGTLAHFDYLSTVSGGGYIGSAYTRLYGAATAPKGVQDGMKRDDTVLLWWLRSNGRYLTPAGARDLLQGFASIFRGALSTHFEVGMLLMLAAAFMLLPYEAVPDWLQYFRDHDSSVWWWAAVLPAAWAGHHVFGYWFRRTSGDVASRIIDFFVAAGGGYIAYQWWPDLFAQLHDARAAMLPALFSSLAWLLLITPTTAFVHSLLQSGEKTSEVRLVHTRWLGYAIAWLGVFLAIGAVDFASAWLADALASSPGARIVAGLSVPGVAVLRWLLARSASVRAWIKARLDALGMMGVVNLVGLALLLLVILTWFTAFQWFWDPSRPWEWLPDARWRKWGILFALPAFYVVFTIFAIDLLNLSSLHNFYRARIERAYVSTGNAMRFKQGVLASRNNPATDTSIPEMNVAQAIDGDDVDLAQHKPHEHGGPIHLVSCCVNQTVDDRTGTYNADRKGVALTVSALGTETGTRWPDGEAVPGKLSTWAAVSGAAASSGMGSQTAPGLAALLFLTGLRLGYWQPALGNRKKDEARRAMRPKLIAAELFARFPGLQSAEWYLSDGGHFENTGVYALLKRKVPLIVLADCGADAGYLLEDVENLVRKACIDYAAKIEFIAPPAGTTKLHEAIGTPASFRKPVTPEDHQSLLLARIDYADGTCGTLVVVKPRVVTGVSLDLASYAGRNTAFPQQTTGDQFFDEAQWEAYHQLGLHLGDLLTPDNLLLMRGWV